MLNQQFRILNIVVLFVAAVLCLSWIPISLARNLENSKNEVHDGLSGGPGKANNNQFSSGPLAYYGIKRNLRSLVLNPKEYQQRSHGKAPVSMDLVDFLLEYEDDDRSKRFDDYGHMRFGKRGGEEQFDDYGHMRFGRSI